ncbi:MAG: CAP domain-containing protein [Propionicimonas sp.]|nr:CAP domain-containing protein [Propionicimonas sp.]
MPATTLAVATADPGDYAEALFAETNRLRVERGLAEFEPSDCAREAALARTRELVGRPLVHASLAGVIAACAPPSATAGENLSRAEASPAEVVAAWLASPGHANNLLSPQLAAAGVGCVADTVGGRTMVLCSEVFLG